MMNKDCYTYLPIQDEDRLWGLSISTVGTALVKPFDVYPSPKHPNDYYFSPQSGRVLPTYSLLYIVSGKGTLRTHSIKEIKVSAGDMFLIFPNEWHSYFPDPETGWQEYWICFEGRDMDERVKHGFFDKESPIYKVGESESLLWLYRKAIDVAQEKPMFFQQLLSGLVNQMIGLVLNLDSQLPKLSDSRMHQNIIKARSIMRASIDKNVTPIQVANELNIGYELFRKRFKEETGFSPNQYLINIRIERAKELLMLGQSSVKHIAYKLCFQSSEYFSAFFKKKTGYSPQAYRALFHQGKQAQSLSQKKISTNSTSTIIPYRSSYFKKDRDETTDKRNNESCSLLSFKI